MTLREILAKIPFDSIVPYIKQGDEPDDVCHYKQAYDILLHTKADEAGCDKVYVCVDKYEDGSECVSASRLEGCHWSEYIDGEIVLDEGVEVSDEELAFRLLWHLTFFGYNQEEMGDYFQSLSGDGYHDNEYGRMARAIERKRYMLWANKAIRKRILQSIKEHEAEGEHSFGLSEEDWNYIHHHERHCNRMKRKRDYRLGKRLEELENLDLCENTIRMLLEGQSVVTRADLAFLWDSTSRRGNEFQTRVYGAANRLYYLDELITKYEAMAVVARLRQVVVKVSTSTAHPLTQEEADYVRRKMEELTGSDHTLIIHAVNEVLGSEMGVLVVGPEKELKA